MYTAEKFGSMVSLGIWGGIFARVEFDSTTFLTNAIVGVVLLCAGLLTPVFSLTTVHDEESRRLLRDRHQHRVVTATGNA